MWFGHPRGMHASRHGEHHPHEDQRKNGRAAGTAEARASVHTKKGNYQKRKIGVYVHLKKALYGTLKASTAVLGKPHQNITELHLRS